MNRKIGAIAASLLLGAVGALGASELAVPTPAGAQAGNPYLLMRVNQLERRLSMVESRVAWLGPRAQLGGGQASTPGGQYHTSTGVGFAGAGQTPQLNQVVILQGQVATLTAQLQALQSQFATHHHAVPMMTNPSGGHGVNTILNCSGYGKACTAATSETEITVLVPSNVPPPQSQPYTIQTSGPEFGGP